MRHGLRNALIPVVTLIGIDFGTVIGAAILTETVFSWPGIGSQIADSVGERDLPVLLGLTLVVVIAYALDQPVRRPVVRLVRSPHQVGLMASHAPAVRRRSPDGDDRAPRRRPGAGHGERSPATGSPTSSPAGRCAPTSCKRFRRNKLAMVGLVLHRPARDRGRSSPR